MDIACRIWYSQTVSETLFLIQSVTFASIGQYKTRALALRPLRIEPGNTGKSLHPQPIPTLIHDSELDAITSNLSAMLR